MFGNTTPSDNLWQNPFNTWKNNLTAGMSAFSAPQTENKPAFDLGQAIPGSTESVRASMNHANQPMQTNAMENNHLSATGNSPIPAAYGSQQTTNNVVPKQTSLQENDTPPQFYAEEQTETQNEVPWILQTIYAAKEEPTPQVHYIRPYWAAAGTPSLSLTTGSVSYQPTNHMVTLSGSSATPLAANASNTVQGYTNSNTNNASNGYANHYSEGTSIPTLNNNREEDSLLNKMVGAVGQYGDGGTVPAAPWFDTSNPEEVRTLIQELQKYEPYIQSAADEAYEKLPDIAHEAASLVIPKLPPHLKGTALGALIILGICLCAKEAYDEWDERSGKEGFIVLFSDKLMFYFTEEWVEHTMDTFGIPKKYSRPILFAVKDALSTANG